MTYNERVQAIAEEMARADIEAHCIASDSPQDFDPELDRSKWYDSLKNEDKQKWINGNMHAARVAVKHMADEVSEFFNRFVLPALPKGDLSFSPDALADYLLERGLSPDNQTEPATDTDGK